MFNQRDLAKITDKMAAKYSDRRNQSLYYHESTFQRFQQKEQQLVRCFKIKNENTHIQSLDSMKKCSHRSKQRESSAVTALKQEAVNA